MRHEQTNDSITMQKNLEYYASVFKGIWESFIHSPIWAQIGIFLGVYFSYLWNDLHVFITAVIFLTVIDAHYAIKACIKNKGKYESKLLKQGLLQKFKLYMTIAIVTIVLDNVFHKIYNYESHYFTFLIFAFVCLYEAGSIVEKLAKVYPESKAVKKLAKALNLTEKKLDDKMEL